MVVLLQFFQEGNGQFSMTRLCTFMLISGGIIMAFVHPDNETGYLGMIALGLGGKVGQKWFEEKPKKEIKEEPKPTEET